MMPILLTTERACAELAASASMSASVDANIYTGIDDEAKEAPAVICYSEGAEEEFPQSGVWKVRTNIIVKEISADTTGSVGRLSDVIYEKFLTVDTGSLSQAVSNYSVYDVFVENTSNSVSEDAWVQTLTLNIVCVLT